MRCTPASTAPKIRGCCGCNAMVGQGLRPRPRTLVVSNARTLGRLAARRNTAANSFVRRHFKRPYFCWFRRCHMLTCGHGNETVPSERRQAPSPLCAKSGDIQCSEHQAGPFPRSVSCICLSSALLTNSTESIAAPSWVRNCSIASFIGGGRSPHQLIA